MSWVIGDVHGCYYSLQKLISKLPENDIIFIGDLINRGPESAKTLDFICANKIRTVLGNHDLALLAMIGGFLHPHPDDCFRSLIEDSKIQIWASWLKTLPFMLNIQDHLLSHAGFYPYWTEEEHQKTAEKLNNFFKQLDDFKNLEKLWMNAQLITNPCHIQNEFDEMAFGINIFTRMRYLSKDGSLALHAKGSPDLHPDLHPWFKLIPFGPLKNKNIIFGHWSALRGGLVAPHIIATDSGCVWGEFLSAYHLSSKTFIKQECLDGARRWQAD